MIKPMLSLAMSMQSHKSVSVLLLGSGISRTAGILTGWGIIIDLIDRIRQMYPEGKNGDGDFETWYIDTCGKQPDYSEFKNIYVD